MKIHEMMAIMREQPPPEDGEGDPQIHVCEGPPICQLQGDEAIAAQQAGCPWCKTIIVHPDGTETVIHGGTA